MMTPIAPDTGLELTTDDRVLLHAVAMAGDAVSTREIDYLLERWPWAAPMTRGRIYDLELAGLLHRTDTGWFAPLAVDLAAADGLPRELDPLLKGFVGEMLCRNATSFERFQLGARRMIAGGRDHALVAASRAWAATPAAMTGPRGTRFVEALGAKRLGPVLGARLREAVPELREPSRWTRPFRELGARLAGQPSFQRAAAAAAAVGFVALDVLGRSAPVLGELDKG